jgi:ferredoxin--NADP+ reductase
MYKDWQSGNNPMPGNHKLYCLQGGSRSWEFGYREELDRIAAEVPWFKFVTTISRPWEDAFWTGETGRVDDLVRKYADLWDCGQKPRPHTCVGIPACARTGKASSTRRLAERLHVRRGLFHSG